MIKLVEITPYDAHIMGTAIRGLEMGQKFCPQGVNFARMDVNINYLACKTLEGDKNRQNEARRDDFVACGREWAG